MVATFGAKAPTGMPRWRSSRCLPNVAAWAELPRAHVRTKLGGFRLMQRTSSSSAGCSSIGWRRTASGPFRHSASMLARMSLTGVASDWRRCRAKARLAQHSFANCSLALLIRQNQVRSVTVLLPVSDSLKPMDTERASPRYSDIDVWAPLDIAEAMIEGQFTAVAAVRSARFALLEAALAAAERLRQGGRLVYVGAGTSGRLADGNVKLAALLLHGCEVEEATDFLNRAGGQLRAALAAIGKPSPEPADLSDLPT